MIEPAPDRGELAGQLEQMTLGQFARAARWGRVAVAAAWAALLACGAALGFWFETRAHARMVAEAQAKETAELRDQVRLGAREREIDRRQIERLIVEVAGAHAQSWLIAEHFHIKHAPPAVLPEK